MEIKLQQRGDYDGCILLVLSVVMDPYPEVVVLATFCISFLSSPLNRAFPAFLSLPVCFPRAVPPIMASSIPFSA